MERVLKGLGKSPDTLKKYLNLLIDDPACTGRDKMKLLKMMRFGLLDDIHDKQQLLDNVDYTLYRMKQEGKNGDDDR